MATACADKETIYVFRFGSTKKKLELNEDELHHIPYLSRLVLYDDTLKSSRNENGEYVLQSRIRFSYLQAILHSLRMKNYSFLFTELSEQANINGMLALYDYLNIDPIPIPLLKAQHLIRSQDKHTAIDEQNVKYHRATLLETRETAVQFLVALNKNEYNLYDLQTLHTIFSLSMIILSNPNIFTARLCHHTLAIVETFCFPFFSQKQQNQLHKTQHSKSMHDDVQVLPEDFCNVFTWKGVILPTEKKQMKSLSKNNELPRFYRDMFDIPLLVNFGMPLIHWPEELESIYNLMLNLQYQSSYLRLVLEPLIQSQDENNAKLQSDSARSGRFNTLPKRPKVDKFKYQYPRKCRKY